MHPFAHTPAAAQGRAGPGEQEIAAPALVELGLKIGPGLEPGVLQADADGGADVAQLVVAQEEGERVGGNASCNHIEIKRLRM